MDDTGLTKTQERVFLAVMLGLACVALLLGAFDGIVVIARG